MLEVHGLSHSYGRHEALRDVSVRVRAGEVVAILGANGAGKTTLLNSVAALIRPKEGSIRFQGKELVGRSANEMVELGIAAVPENRRLFDPMSVSENLELGAYCPRARARRHETITRVYKLFPILAERERQLGSSLSGGQQQMLAIGRALMAVPDLIIFDEISLGLAPLVIGQLYQAVAEINRHGTTVLLVEQNVHRSLETAHRAYVIEHGRIVLSGTAQELSLNRQFRESYFGL